MNNNIFQPDWVSPPGQTINDMLIQRNFTVDDFCKSMDCDPKFLSNLLTGNEPVTEVSAKKLESVLGGTEEFWITREKQYREDLERSEELKNDWLNELPIPHMVKNSWIEPFKNKEEKFINCLKFFGVESLSDWYDSNHEKMYTTAFRTSDSFDSKPESVITWLRQGEIKSKKIQCETWNAKNLKNSIPEIRVLTRNSKPQEFIPLLRKILAKCGVALAIVKTPTKCHASGATYFTSPDKALLFLSFRHLRDDHFWFSLFHEIGHLLLHGNKKIFLEGLDKHTDIEERKMEDEADDFSENVLIPAEFKSEFKSLRASNWKQIVRFAKKIGVSRGIVVGQLQYQKIIKPNQLNKLKVKYQWAKN